MTDMQRLIEAMSLIHEAQDHLAAMNAHAWAQDIYGHLADAMDTADKLLLHLRGKAEDDGDPPTWED